MLGHVCGLVFVCYLCVCANGLVSVAGGTGCGGKLCSTMCAKTTMPKFDLALKDGAVSPIKFLSNHSLSQEKRAVTALAAGEDNIILLNT